MLDDTTDAYNQGVADAAAFADRLATQMEARGAAGQAGPVIAALRHVAKAARGLMQAPGPQLGLPDPRPAMFEVRAAVPA